MLKFGRELLIIYELHSAAVYSFYLVLIYGVEENETLLLVQK